jgi:triphosphoribosyl-dephospho-CoA synthetase
MAQRTSARGTITVRTQVQDPVTLGKAVQHATARRTKVRFAMSVTCHDSGLMVVHQQGI